MHACRSTLEDPTYERYTRLLAEKGVIDHSDQVALCLRLLRQRPAVLERVAGRYRHVLIDELQDANRSQLELVRVLASQTPNVVAVGDPVQSIYGFRGAVSGNVDQFTASFDQVRTIQLRRNYRSAPDIVAAGDRVRGHADPALRASIAGQVAHRRRQGRVRLVEFATPESEADGVAREISEALGTGRGPSEFAVLVRSNGEVDSFVRSLRVHGVPAISTARATLLDDPVVRALVAFLRVVADPTDSVELYALATPPPYRIPGGLLATLLNGARRRNRSLWDVLLESVEHHDQLTPGDARALASLVDNLRDAIGRASERPSGEVLYDYLRRSGLLARLAHAATDEDAAAAQRVARFCELVRDRARLLVHDRVHVLVSHLTTLDVPADDADGSDDVAAVHVLTVHRAKGLEFKTVYVSGLVDGKFPVRSRPPELSLPEELLGSGPDDAETALAEERRLFYVALTRARDELCLTTHATGPRGRGRRRPSPFIAEAIDAPPALMAPAPPATDLGQLLNPPLAEVAHETRRAERPLTLSYSQVDEYLTCPERYRLRYDVGIPTPPHHALSYGSAIHQAIAAFHGAQLRGDQMGPDEVVAAYARAWQPEGFLSRDHEEARFVAGREALLRFRDREVASAAVPAAVEQPFSFRLGMDEFRGRIDRLDATADGVVITDYKSSEVRDQKRADSRARDSLQLSVYALAHHAATGALPAALRLHFVETGLTGSVVPDTARLEKARATLAGTAAAIRSRQFDPKPNPVACGFCPFRAICRASAA